MLARFMLAIFVAAAACGGKTKPAPPTPETGGTDGGSDAVSCEPGRCLDEISAAIMERRPDARKCYEAGVERQPGLAGKLIINFAIDADGVVVETSQGMQDEQIAEQGVVDCVSEVIKSIRFAKSAQGKTTRAYHRFEFAP